MTYGWRGFRSRLGGEKRGREIDGRWAIREKFLSLVATNATCQIAWEKRRRNWGKGRGRQRESL